MQDDDDFDSDFDNFGDSDSSDEDSSDDDDEMPAVGKLTAEYFLKSWVKTCWFIYAHP